ncbi:hypothetical protein K3495_g9938 [Podosphaera aphanis]|nr:hypothetical protein K3495_g9938 [Podosphaera aphanis]
MAVSVRSIIDANLTAIYDISQSSVINRTDPETYRLITTLVFAEKKSVRTSTIILAAFNIIAALTTTLSILYDCYWTSRRVNSKYRASKLCISSIHPAETFPLVLSIGIVIQGLIFAGIQGEGLKGLYTRGCSTIAQVLWPAIFIVPYIQLVFGLECVLRSFRTLPFQARGKFDVTICCGVIVLMLFLTWLPSHLLPEPNVCYASLLSFISRYREIASIILTSAAGLMVISGSIIFYRLSTVNLIDQHQRIAASRIVHYLVIGVFSLILILPHFFSLVVGQDGLKLSMMATVVLNLSGLMSGLLHLILRSNTSTTSFGPKEGSSWDCGKHQIRIFGPNELAMYSSLVDPVPGPMTDAYYERQFSQSSSHRRSPIRSEKRGIDTKNLYSPPFKSPRRDELSPKGVMNVLSPYRSHARKPSYSLFPQQETFPTTNQPNPQLPISIYDISELGLPQPTFGRSSRHFRDSSDSSSATVQIGLRLSHAPSIDMSGDDEALPLPATTYNARAAVTPLSLPPPRLRSPLPPPLALISPTKSPLSSPLSSPDLTPLTSPAPLQPRIFSGFQRAVLPPVPLRVDTTFISPSARSSPRAVPINSQLPQNLEIGSLSIEGSNHEVETRASSSTLLSTETARESAIKLSPMVYKPEKRSNPLKKSPLSAAPIDS